MQNIADKYFEGELPRDFKFLLTGRTMMLVAAGLLGLFLPVFFYKLFNNDLKLVVIFYGLSSALYVLVLPFGVRFFDEHIGLKKSMILSLLFISLFYATTFFATSLSVETVAILALVFLVIFRTSFWVSYKTDLAKLTDAEIRGREMSTISAIQMFLAVVLPIVAAIIIDHFGFGTIFVIAIVIYIFTAIPFSKLPPMREDFQWSFTKTWNVSLSALKKKKVFHAYVAAGAESVVGLFIWPIYIFELLQGNFLEVGVVSALVVLVTVVIQLFTGKYLDESMSKGKALQIGSVLYALGWFFKIFILTAFQIFIAGTYHSVVKIFIQTPFNTMTMDMSADEGHYVDEFSVIIEMATHIGRLLMCIIVFIMLFFVSIQWTFLIAAFASILINLLSADDLHLERPFS